MSAWLVFPPLWLALLVIVGILLSLIWPERRDEWPGVAQHRQAMNAIAHVQSLAGVTTLQPHGSGNGDDLGSGQGLLRTSRSVAERRAPAAPVRTSQVA